jgi:hypothetical protein
MRPYVCQCVSSPWPRRCLCVSSYVCVVFTLSLTSATTHWARTQDMHHIVNLIAKEFSEQLLSLEGGSVEALMAKQKLFTERPIADIFGTRQLLVRRGLTDIGTNRQSER